MTAVSDTFRDAFEHVMASIPDQKRKAEIQQFVGGISWQYSMYMAFTTNELPNLIERVFRHESVRDFVLRLTMAFQARLGALQGDELPKVLARSMSFRSENAQSDPAYALPDQIKSNLPAYEDVLEVLQANTWVVTVCMISLYLRIETSTAR